MINYFDKFDDPTSLSDHNAIFCDINIDFNFIETNDKYCERAFHKFDWEDENFVQNYQKFLSLNLEPLINKINDYKIGRNDSKTVINEINQEFLNDILKNLKRNKAAGNDYIKCTDLNVGSSINGLNLSIIAYCNDIVLISPSYGQLVTLLKKFLEYSKEWKIDFNPKKSVCLSMTNSGKIINPSILIDGTHIANVQGFEYLGLPRK
ncbi:unnamed protein product [Brachionus calyciflorus]|uniref:Reverse transcriptase domain-containing protein n=1 Tax=Brachionus calyciflorus TaxID=104777 RepID=A0A814DHM2_9BILA|nr:unnamed protein product [Brachionus calyciflorus]